MTTSALTSVSTPVSERNISSVPIMDSEILHSIHLPGEKLDTTPQTDISPSEATSESFSVSPSELAGETSSVSPSELAGETPSESPSADSEDEENAIEQQLNKIIFKFSDNKGCERKKQFKREFLLQLQSHPMSLCKPDDLPNLDAIKYKPYDASDKHRSQRRGGKEAIKDIPSSSEDQNIKLHESPNPWRPLHKCETLLDEKDRLKRTVLRVLNKLTPQKFATTLFGLKRLKIDTEEKLSLVTDLIFEKAVNEPKFSCLYANLCKHLALIKVPASETSGTQKNFRKMLLTKCQKEFEQDRSGKLQKQENMKILEAVDADKRKALELEYEEEEKKYRNRQLGNLKFIGELLKLGMLVKPIILECIKRLLSEGDEESLKCLSVLLTTVGKEMYDTHTIIKDSQIIICFAQIQLIIDKRLTSSRVRFMLQDVIDLKNNNWVPKRDDNPKTIDQIRKEAKREARKKQENYQNVTNYLITFDDGDQQKYTGLQHLSEDWILSSESSESSGSLEDPFELKPNKPADVESLDHLQDWIADRNSRVDSYKTTLTNEFSELSEQSLSSNYEDKRESQILALSSRESSHELINQMPPSNKETSSASKDAVQGLIKTFEDTVAEIKATGVFHLDEKAIAEESTLSDPEYNEDDIQRKTKHLIDEFLLNNDIQDTIKCVMEIASQNAVHVFINTAINQILEKSNRDRYSLGKLLLSLLKKEIMTFDHFKKGFSRFSGIFEVIDDYDLDIPIIYDSIGEIMEPMIKDIDIFIKVLKEVLQPCLSSEKADMLLSAILHCGAKREGTIKIGEIWRESGVQWTDIIGTDRNVAEFIKKHKFEFTVSPMKSNPQPQKSMEEMKKSLLNLFEKNAELEEVFDWVDANVFDTSNSTFIRALVTAVHESCLSDSRTTWELNTSKLKSRTPLISRYVSTNEKLQLQALYAVQALMNQLGQPSGLLHQIFDVLYDDDVISDESFLEWEESDDPNEAEGKSVAVHSVKSFLKWIREPLEEIEEMNFA